MKRSIRKRSLSCFLAGVMVLGLAIPTNAVAQTASGALDNPFAAMYDSDNLFLEEVGPVLEMELMYTYQSTDESDDKMDMPLPLDMVRFNVGELSQQKPQQEQYSTDSQNLLSEDDLSNLSMQVMNAIKEDNLEGFRELELEEKSRDEIEKLYEDSRVDSYIVKYKDPESRERLLSNIQIADVVEAVAVELPLDYQVNLKEPMADEVQTVHSTEDLENEIPKSSSGEDLTKEENETSGAADVTEDVSESSVADADMLEGEVAVPTDQVSEKEDVPLVLNDSNNQSANQKKSTDTSHEKDVDTGLLERIVLSEKVNPAEFATQLKAAGLAQDIEYIQPDFLFSYASLGLVVTEVAEDEDGIATGTPGSDTAEAGEDTATGADTENKEDATGNSEESKVDDTKELENQPNEEKLSEAERLEQERLEAERLEQERLEEERLKQLDKQPQVLQDVIVALIDTGVDINHPALQENLLPGWNFVANNNDVYNEDYPMQAAHGTHIAGIIAQNSQSEHVKIMPLQVFGEHGAYTSDIIAAIHFAEQNGAQVVNMSFGSGSYNFALEETMSQSGMLFVSAAGNARSDLVQAPVYPAAFTLDNMISVASLNADKGFSYYSNYNPTLVDIAAFGRDVESALPEGEYGLQSGTSMSAGYVSSAAGSVLTQNPDLQAGELKQRLLVTADMYEHLENKVAGGHSLNQANAVANNIQTETTSCNYEEDFDVHGYQPTPNESWELFSSKTVVGLSAGNDYSLALCSDGTVWGWGRNTSGQLGNGNKINSIAPVQVIGLTNVTAISAGSSHSMALKSDGTVWAWGSDNSGALGNGSTTSSTTPVQVSGLSNVSDISAGSAHSLALKTDKTVWAWGSSTYGQVGNGSTSSSSTPVKVSNLSSVSKIAAGGYHSLALKTDGTVWSWGLNDFGQLGNGSTTDRTTPVQVSGLSGASGIAGGDDFSFALKTNGTLWAWGYNYSGQLGIGNNTNRTTPYQVSSLSNVSSISAGAAFASALKSDGTVWSWGYNYAGQLGNGTTTTRNTPVQASGLTNVSSISVGRLHVLALKKDSTVWSWGYNAYGQLGNGGTSDSSRPIQALLNWKIPTSVVFNPISYTSIIPAAGDAGAKVTVKATVLDQNGQAITNAVPVVYGLKTTYTGVSINTSTGVATITSLAAPGTVIVTATSGTLTANANLVLTGRIPVSITFNSESYTSPIPEAGAEDKEVTVIATVSDEDNKPIESTPIVYALLEIYDGVTIDSNTGVVTITSQAVASTVVVTATSGTLTANVNLVLGERIPTSITFNSKRYTSPIPEANAEDKQITVSATVLGEDGEPMGSTPIVYALDEEYEGVTIDGNTGVVTITSQAIAGTVVVTATSGTFTANVNLVLGGTPERNQATISATAGKYYDITVIAGRVEDFSGMEITLVYDADVFELADLCSFTKQKELSVGSLSEMGITVTNLSAGEVRFNVDKTIPDGREWSGVLDVIRLKANTTGEGDVSITQ